MHTATVAREEGKRKKLGTERKEESDRAMDSTAFSRVGMVVLGLLLAGLVLENFQTCTDLATLGARCAPFVARELPPAPPSEDCCNVVRGADLNSVCGRITLEIERMISMQKVVDVASRCGKTIPSGTKCGSFTVPKA